MKWRAISLFVSIAGLAFGAAARNADPYSEAVNKAVSWLVRVQGPDGGWGQDGGETNFVRQGEHLETQGNDAANTAVATLALLRAGHTPARGTYSGAVRHGVEFVLREVEASPEEGLAVTRVTGSQIQRKLGPHIDTFLSSMLLSEVDGNMGDPAANRRVRGALEKCVRKIQRHQLSDGSWNIAGGWAPILGTSLASRSLDTARQKGVKTDEKVLAKVNDYTKQSLGAGAGAGGRMSAASAGVPLYARAQQLEQLSRTVADRAKNAKEIRAVTGELSAPAFVRGFGSMGGEEFFSYLNISDSLRRTGGPEWTKWNSQIKTTLIDLQNQDGTWAGHHCITGRVAATSAAVLTLFAERQPTALPTSTGVRQ